LNTPIKTIAAIMNIFSSIGMLFAPLTYCPSGFNSWMVVYWSTAFEAFIDTNHFQDPFLLLQKILLLQ